MTTRLKIPRRIYLEMMRDLARRHEFAYERVGFCRVKLGNREGDNKYLFVVDYWPVADQNYIPDAYAGARINSQAIREALQTTLTTGDGILHVHLHDFPFPPRFSIMDQAEIPRVVESLVSANPNMPHGMLLLSPTHATAKVALPGQQLMPVDTISIVGQPTILLSETPECFDTERFSRQTFLGPEAPTRINSVKIGIVGVSGGGSHVAQQLVHTGFATFILFDKQAIDLSNLNRWVGATEEDVALGRLKVAIADRVIKGVNKAAQTELIPARWQDHPQALRDCDLAIACLDGFDERRQLEAACRRFLIPLIDIGMNVAPATPPRMAGQVILSMPGYPCMKCIGFLNERTLAAEALAYGEETGPNPQVVWPNAILAATAVGIAVDLVTDWRKSAEGLIYKSYDGNSDAMSDHARFKYVRDLKCEHYPLLNIGDFSF